MVRKKLTINNPTGLHLRPAGLFCKTAMQFQSKITFLSKNTSANAKSVLSVLGACIKKGDVIEIQFGMKTVEAEVLDIQDTTKKEEAKNLFRYL